MYRRLAGWTSLALATNPTVSLALVSLAEHPERSGRPSGGGPVALGAPPIWFIWLVLEGLSLPWVVVGILLLCRVAAARWIAAVLAVPTALLTFMAMIAATGPFSGRDSIDVIELSAFGPIAAAGAAFCFAVGFSEFASWRGGGPSRLSS